MVLNGLPVENFSLMSFGPQRSFQGTELLQIAFPLGGIGAGTICLNGQGGLQDFSIRHTPSTSAAPDGHSTTDAAFATLFFPKTQQARLVEGPLPPERVYDQGLKGQGYRGGGHEGLPRYRNCTFQGEFPFAAVTLSDPELPLTVKISAFNPFIPLDDHNSSIPCAILEYTLINDTDQPVPFEFGYHLSHLAYGKGQNDFATTRNQAIPGLGAYLYNEEDPASACFGSCAVGMPGFSPLIKAMWFRGGWFDSLSVLWKEVSTGKFTTNDGSKAPGRRGRNGASLLVKQTLPPGQHITIPVVITWHFPNVITSAGQPEKSSKDAAECGDNCDCRTQQPRWQPYYSAHWQNAADVLTYVQQHYQQLRDRTAAFHKALFSSTLPDYVLDAVSANLGILKSPTVLRQANGNVWAWEGCFNNSGCCHGTCTHVWNYAQAMPHLFPTLERTLREQELLRSLDERGHVNFRAALPDGPTGHGFHAAADGQLGGIMKLHREWCISGDCEWLRSLYPSAKRSMDYCIDTWDPFHRGVLTEPHHNTYDIEFWGPDGMCSSFYLGALSAMMELATAAGCPEDASFYQELGQRGAALMDKLLFNGEYYEQKVMLKGLRASPTDEELAALRRENLEAYHLLVIEGPKYQYGSGCLSDSVFGAWLAELCGVKTFQNQANIHHTLESIFKYNFKPSLWEHANTQRPGYAIGDEPGLLLCTWPRGGKPTLPFVYSDEVWTGIEYQVASHMIAQGMIEEGLTIVKALRSRYDGRKRNPWNEYECGNYYARAMASYALLLALSGFRYSAPDKTLLLEPRLNIRPFRTFFSTAFAWGMLTLQQDSLKIEIIEGDLPLERVLLTENGTTEALHVGHPVKGNLHIPIPLKV